MCQAADIYVAGMRWTGIPAIWKHQASVVYLISPGGSVDAAIEIGLRFSA
jgi:hypothetical protein